ncbi:MAG: hypothetical protein KA009_01595 [Rhodoluna sp.]|nr:hypothetical protein [Rhodoluna sp.]
MRRVKVIGLGGAMIVASIASASLLAGTQAALAEELVSTDLGGFQIYDGPALTPPPINFGPVRPPIVQLPEVPIAQEPTTISTPVQVPTPAPTLPPEPTPPAAAIVLVSKPVLVAVPAMTYTMQLPAGSKVITPAAKATLAKTAEAVKASSKPASISVKTAGTTMAKATAQANALVAELRKRGVSAVTVIKRVGKKTSVSVLVTKKKP